VIADLQLAVAVKPVVVGEAAGFLGQLGDVDARRAERRVLDRQGDVLVAGGHG
jgi:hypothetical protein